MLYFNKVFSFFSLFYHFFFILLSTVKRMNFIYYRRKSILNQLIYYQLYSLPLIIISAIFSGAVTAESANYQFRDFIPNRYIGTASALSIILELSPVIMSLMLAVRISASIAAELGSMKEKEELDALEILNIDFYSFFALPRFIACLLAFPILNVFFTFFAIISAGLVSYFSFDLNSERYIYGLRALFDSYHFLVANVKVFSFAIVVCVFGIYCGLNSKGGASGIGLATMRSVVFASVGIIVCDFVINYFMLLPR